MSSEITANVVNLARCTVLDAEGRKLLLGMLWQKQPAILIFLRHFACIACRAHAAQVWEKREQYERTGSKIIFIGNGSADFIQHFKESIGLKGALVLTDPSLESFKAAGFKHGFMALVQPRSAVNAAKLAIKGHTQASYSSEAGTHWQMGGVVAVNTEGRAVYQFISVALGDFPPETDVPRMAG